MQTDVTLLIVQPQTFLDHLQTPTVTLEMNTSHLSQVWI